MSRLAARSSAIRPLVDEPLYDRSFVLSFAGQTGFVLVNTLATTHFARWVDFLGGDTFEAGLVSGVGMLAALFLRPWIGQWINRWGALQMWFCGLAVFAIGTLGNAAVTSLGPLIFVLRGLLGLGASLVFASSLTYVAQNYPAARRTEAIGVLGAGGFLGMIMGPQLGDYILSAQQRQRSDFLLLFILAAIALAIPALLLAFVRRPDVKPVKGSVKLSQFVASSREHWPGAILLVILCFGLCMTVPFVFLANFIDEEHIVTGGMLPIGIFFYCYAGWGLIVRLSLRRLPERIGRRKVLLAGIACMTIGMSCYLLVSESQPWMLVVPALISGTGHALMFHTMTSIALERFPPEQRGTGSALALMMLDLGMVGGSPILGWIADSYGFGAMFASIAACCALSFLVFLRDTIPVWRARAAESC